MLDARIKNTQECSSCSWPVASRARLLLKHMALADTARRPTEPSVIQRHRQRDPMVALEGYRSTQDVELGQTGYVFLKVHPWDTMARCASSIIDSSHVAQCMGHGPIYSLYTCGMLRIANVSLLGGRSHGGRQVVLYIYNINKTYNRPPRAGPARGRGAYTAL